MPNLIEIYDVPTAQAGILRRRAWDEFAVPDRVLDRNAVLFGERIQPEEAVRRILADVRDRGDAALAHWSEILDGVQPLRLQVTADDIQAAYAQVDPAVIDAMRLSADRVAAFHRRQPAMSWIHNDHEGTLGQLVRPIERVGVYVPGGTAPLPSTLLMTAVRPGWRACPLSRSSPRPSGRPVFPTPPSWWRQTSWAWTRSMWPGAPRPSPPWPMARRPSPPWTKSAAPAGCTPSWPSARSTAWWASTACPAPRRPW